MGMSIQDRHQKTLSSLRRQVVAAAAAAATTTMDRAAAEFPLQGGAFWPARRSCKRHGQGKLFGCLLAFCLLAVFTLALPVLYLLSRHHGEPLTCKAEERAVGRPESLIQNGTPPALKPRIHLTELDLHAIKCVPNEFPTLQWKYKSNSEAGIKYENGFLVIPKPGDYFVYSQVTFRDIPTERDNCNMDTKAVTHVTQIISKLSDRYPVPIELMTSRRSIGEARNWNHAIYLGAIAASLQKNDKLFVNVSNAKLVHNKGRVTFFGAFLI